MKKVVTAAASDRDIAYKYAEKILRASKDLLDIMDAAPAAVVENNDILDLYNELIEAIPAFQMAIKTKTLDF